MSIVVFAPRCFSTYRSIKGGCQSGRKVAPHNSKSDLPLARLCSARCLLFVTVAHLLLPRGRSARFGPENCIIDILTSVRDIKTT